MESIIYNKSIGILLYIQFIYNIFHDLLNNRNQFLYIDFFFVNESTNHEY